MAAHSSSVRSAPRSHGIGRRDAAFRSKWIRQSRESVMACLVFEIAVVIGAGEELKEPGIGETPPAADVEHGTEPLLHPGQRPSPAAPVNAGGHARSLHQRTLQC